MTEWLSLHTWSSLSPKVAESGFESHLCKYQGLPWWLELLKNLPAMQETWVWPLGQEDPRIRKIPWRREWPPTPVFLPREFHGQRSLVGYSLWGSVESDTAERLYIIPKSVHLPSILGWSTGKYIGMSVKTLGCDIYYRLLTWAIYFISLSLCLFICSA